MLIKKHAENKTLIESYEREVSNYLNYLPQPMYLGERKEPYSFGSFGVYSPLLENSDVTLTSFDYLRNKFSVRSAEYKKKDPGAIYISTTSRDGLYKPAPEVGLVFFEPGWEWVTPTTLEDLKKSNEGTFVNKSGIKMYWTYGNMKSLIYSVRLTYYKAFSPIGPLYVQLSTPVSNTVGWEDNSQTVEEGKKVLTEFANTITTK